MNGDATFSSSWLARLRRGEPQALPQLFEHYRARLRRLVELRLDPRLAGRVDPSDVMQEVYLDAAGQVRHYLRNPSVGVYIWLRGLLAERLVMIGRRHLGAQCRAVGRECRLPANSSAVLASRLLGRGTTPSQHVAREEARRRVQRAVAQLEPADREVILMRHFEGLANGEMAEVLGLTDSAASKRYGRALFRLKQVLLKAWPPGESRP